MYTTSQLALLRAANANLLIAGIDTIAGNELTSIQLSYASSITGNFQSGISYDAANKRLIVSKDGAVISGYTFNGITLYITGRNVIVKNSTFQAGPDQLTCVQAIGAGVTVKNCTFNGGSLSNPLPLSNFITGSSLNIDSDRFLNAPGDAIDIRSGTVKNCYFSGGGFSSTQQHPDAIWISGSDGPTIITGNFIDWTSTYTNNNATGATNNAIRITPELGKISNVTVTDNVLLGGETTIYASNAASGAYTNVNISNNYIGFGRYGSFYGTPAAGVNFTNNNIIDYSSSINSVKAWNIYVSSGISTSKLLVSTQSNDLYAPNSSSSTLYGAGNKVHLVGSLQCETVFVGGAGVQYEQGGKGANIFKYLAFSDSSPLFADGLNGFDAAKDIIDLSAINVDPGGAGQAFSFVGGAAFSAAGAQVRVIKDANANMTYVDATMAGDAMADLRIRISGLVDLTAANFALTKAQSAAAVAAGAALKVTRTAATSGANMYSYTNVLGHSYGSYESIYDKSSTLVAQAFNLASGTGSVELMGAGLIYSDGSSGESLKIGTSTFSIGAHANQTLQLDGSSETLQFHAGFGSATVFGFDVADKLQFDKSMFSYLNFGMSQAQSLAALLSHATSSGSGLRIADTRGDALTLMGVTSAQISSHPGMVTFV